MKTVIDGKLLEQRFRAYVDIAVTSPGFPEPPADSFFPAWIDTGFDQYCLIRSNEWSEHVQPRDPRWKRQDSNIRIDPVGPICDRFRNAIVWIKPFGERAAHAWALKVPVNGLIHVWDTGASVNRPHVPHKKEAILGIRLIQQIKAVLEYRFQPVRNPTFSLRVGWEWPDRREGREGQ